MRNRSRSTAPLRWLPGVRTAEAVGTIDYTHPAATFETNPDPPAAWTPAEINSAQFGFEIEAA